MTFKEILKKNRLIYRVGKIVSHFYYNIFLRYKSDFEAIARRKNFVVNGRFTKIKQFKDHHKGERCFIIATGPSLTIADLELLKNEVTFSMNSICLAFDETKWRPTYYGIQDTAVFEKIKPRIISSKMSNVFIGEPILKKYRVSEDWVPFPLHFLSHKYGFKNLTTKFSNDAYSTVYDGFSITYSLMQIAVYMGFKEIYLLGADCNYKKNNAHHFKEYGLIDPTYMTAGERMISAHKVANTFVSNQDIKIYNATRGGMLEVFPRVDLEEVLGIGIKEKK